ARSIHVLPFLHLIPASYCAGLQAARIQAALRQPAKNGASNALISGAACPRVSAPADRWRSILHSVHGHHRISGRNLPGAAADAGGRAWTPLRAGGVADHRLVESPPRLTTRAQAHHASFRAP